MLFINIKPRNLSQTNRFRAYVSLSTKLLQRRKRNELLNQKQQRQRKQAVRAWGWASVNPHRKRDSQATRPWSRASRRIEPELPAAGHSPPPSYSPARWGPPDRRSLPQPRTSRLWTLAVQKPRGTSGFLPTEPGRPQTGAESGRQHPSPAEFLPRTSLGHPGSGDTGWGAPPCAGSPVLEGHPGCWDLA